MIHVKTRRRLAASVIVLFLAASLTLTYMARREWAPGALVERARRDFHDATGLNVTFSGATVFVDNTVVFDGASIGNADGEILSASKVAVTGLPRPGSAWKPERLDLAQLTASAHLRGGLQLRTMVIMDGLMEEAGIIRVTLPEYITVEIRHPGVGVVDYGAPGASFRHKRILELVPVDRQAPESFEFTVAPTEATLRDDLNDAGDPLVKALVDAAQVVLARTDQPSSGHLTAVWKKGTEKVTFENETGWRLESDRFASLAKDGELRVVLTSFVTEDGRLAALDGSIEAFMPLAKSQVLAECLAAVGLSGLSGDGVPDAFENVHVALGFSARDGQVKIRPQDERPALIWSEVDGKPIALFTGEGCGRLDDVMGKLLSAAGEN